MLPEGRVNGRRTNPLPAPSVAARQFATHPQFPKSKWYLTLLLGNNSLPLSIHAFKLVLTGGYGTPKLLLQQSSLRKLIPFGNRVLVKRFEAVAKTASGIYLPDADAKQQNEGEVVAVGPGARATDARSSRPRAPWATRCCCPSTAAARSSWTARSSSSSATRTSSASSSKMPQIRARLEISNPEVI